MTPDERRHRKRAYKWRVKHREDLLSSTILRTFRMRFPNSTTVCGRCHLPLKYDNLTLQTTDGRFFHHATVYGGCFTHWFDDWLLTKSLEETTIRGLDANATQGELTTDEALLPTQPPLLPDL